MRPGGPICRPTKQAAVDWLATLERCQRLALLAHCASFGVNSLFEKVDRYGGSGVTPMACSVASIRRTAWRVRSISTWRSWLATDRRQLSRPCHQESHPRSGS